VATIRARRSRAACLVFVGAMCLLTVCAVTAPHVAQARGGGGVGGGASLADQALEQEGLADRPVPGQWSATLGVGAASESRYQGADSSRVKVVPLVSVRYENFFFGPFGLGWSAINLKGFHAGPILGYQGGRSVTDSPNLSGLSDVPASVTGGAFVRCRLGRFEVLSTVRQAVTHSSDGLDALLKVDYRVPLIRPRLELRFGPHLGFADSEYEQTFFGITPSQSAQSGLPVFTPRGGLMDVGLQGSLTYFSTEHFALHAFADVRRFIGDVANSPIVRNPTEHFIGAGIAYHFGDIRH